MARFGLLFTPSWRHVSQGKLVSDAYLGKIQKGGRPDIFRRGRGVEVFAAALGETPRHNTYQWDFVLEDGDFYKGGFMGQMLYVSPSRDLVVAAFATGMEDVVLANIAFARALAKAGNLAAL
jgi:CubicO group peptidase (beta-lactamase class C family)